MFAAIGRATLSIIHRAGCLWYFILSFAHHLLTPPIYARQVIRQCEFVGVQSTPIVLLTAFFTGGVLALQSYYGFNNAAVASTQLGPVVALSMLRELGPVLASLMVAGRVGAAFAAELGTMRVTEQIDALTTLATNPHKYLVVPRVLACILMLPMLVALANTIGIFGGYLVAENVLNLNGQTFLDNAFNAIESPDVVLSLVKAGFFGAIVGIMGCYWGYQTSGGAEGVGKATTTAVVYASVAILIMDYFITALMM